MGKLFVVGDIHGDVSALDKVMKKIDKKYREDRDDLIIFVGDYVDRGLESREVVDYLIDLKGYNTRFLMGNHDYEFLQSVGYFSNLDLSRYNYWTIQAKTELLIKVEFLTRFQLEAIISFLGKPTKDEEETLNYFKNNIDNLIFHGIDIDGLMGNIRKLVGIFKKIESNCLSQLNFLAGLEGCIETDKYIISHSGGTKSTPIEQNTLYDWVWSREYIKHNYDKYFIVGHTPTKNGKVGINNTIKHIFVDTGAIFRGVSIGVYESTYEKVSKVN